MSTPPKHAFELTLTIGAHDWDELVGRLEDITRRLALHGPGATSIFSGGFILGVEARPEQTRERYRVELEKYLAALKCERDDLDKAFFASPGARVYTRKCSQCDGSGENDGGNRSGACKAHGVWP